MTSVTSRPITPTTTAEPASVNATSSMTSSSSNARPDAGEDSDADEVTETRIVGITNTGVIRKRSFKRKMTLDEKRVKRRSYGHAKTEYEEIRRRVLSDRMLTSSVEGLQERLKMLTMMHTDFLDQVAQWQTTRKKKLQAWRTQDRDTLAMLLVPVLVLLLLCWLLPRLVFW